MFVVATLAAIIGSQAMISAVFQIVNQAISQSFFPRFRTRHTSAEVRPFHHLLVHFYFFFLIFIHQVTALFLVR